MSFSVDTSFADLFGFSPFITPTPLQAIHDSVTKAAGISLYIKREDLIHPQISGNKCRKLKYNLLEAKKRGKDTLLTFGGAYSNHLYAVAAAGKLFNFRTIGIVRGEERLPLNATLTFAKDCGMQLYYISRADYQRKGELHFIKNLIREFGDFYLIPEGGSNGLAIKGCAQIVSEITVPFDYLCCACGTGGTLAGLIAGVPVHRKVMGFSVLKGGEFLYKDVECLLEDYNKRCNSASDKLIYSNWQINPDYHFGGYAKSTPELFNFIHEFEKIHHIPLEQVYTGKMLFGIYDLIKKGYFRKGETIIAIHTGGLQGRSS